MNKAFPETRAGFRAMLEGIDLTTESGKEQYVLMLKLAGAADEYYDAMGDNLDMQNDLTESLRRQSETIAKWLSDLNLSALAPVTSMEGYRAEYERQKGLASAQGATDQDVSGFLSYAKTYLEFMRAFGGDYKSIYDAVVGDVEALGEQKDAVVLAIEAADVAAREAARLALEQARLIRTATERIGPSSTPPEYDGGVRGPYAPGGVRAAGGITYGPTLTGEAGQEWIVPTYEPQRSNFLSTVPPQFWENLRGGGASQGGGETPMVKAYFIVDGKVLGETMAKQIPRSASLSDAIRRVN